MITKIRALCLNSQFVAFTHEGYRNKKPPGAEALGGGWYRQPGRVELEVHRADDHRLFDDVAVGVDLEAGRRMAGLRCRGRAKPNGTVRLDVPLDTRTGNVGASLGATPQREFLVSQAFQKLARISRVRAGPLICDVRVVALRRGLLACGLTGQNLSMVGSGAP
jgi:hypothetical protein